MMRPLALLIVSGALLPPAGVAAESPVVRTDHLQSRLVAEMDAAVPGTRLTLGLLLEHDPHWHTYWRNPGDSGLPVELALTLPDGVVAGPIEWPHPQRFDIGELVNFGYDGRRLLPVTIVIPADYAAPSLPVRASASWLICEEECIPGKAEHAFELPVADRSAADARWAGDFAASRARLPGASGRSLVVSEDGGDIVLALDDPVATPARWEWFPETPEVVANGAGPRWQRADTGWLARWPRSEYYTALPAEVAFVAVAGDAGSGDANPAAWRFAGVPAPVAPVVPPAPAPGGDGYRWWPALLIALVAFAIVMALRYRSPSRPEENDR